MHPAQSPSSASPTPPTPPAPPAPPATPPSQPSWLEPLLSTAFYRPCPQHLHLRRADLNLFDTATAQTHCQHCVRVPPPPPSNPAPNTPAPPPPRHLHISRYMYHAVALLREASLHLDTSHIQPYLNNGHRVLYLDRSLQPKSRLAPHAASCVVCARTLQHPYRFCSLRCKLAPTSCPTPALALPPAPVRPRPRTACAPNTPRLVGHAPSPQRTPPSTPSVAPTTPGTCGGLGLSSAPPTPPTPAALAPRGAIAKPRRATPLVLAACGPPPPPLEPEVGAVGGRVPTVRSRRKGRPVHSPAGGGNTMFLMRATLRPLLL